MSEGKGALFFMNGCVGSTKTFLYNTLSTKLHSERKIILCVASSRITTLLLNEGRIAYSIFKIPFEINDTSICGVNKNSEYAAMLRITHLVI